MIPIEHIRDQINGEIFNYSQLMFTLSNYRKPRDVVTTFLKRGQIIRLRKGLYVFGSLWRRAPLCMESIANLMYGPSAISLDYALFWYGLIPERVSSFTSITTDRSHEYLNPVGHFTYTQLSGNRFSVGLKQHTSNDCSFLIAEPLKALADKVWTDSRFRPTSTASYSDYLFEDLRVDEDTLAPFIILEQINAIEKAYSTRKVTWLMEYLLKRFGVFL